MKNQREVAGKFLKKRRLQLGLTQKNIADSIGWNNACYVSQIESGTTTIGMRNLLKVFQVYNLSPDEKWNVFKWLYPEEFKVMKEMACIIAKM